MIARTWRCRCPLEHRDGFLRHLEATGVRESAALAGYLGHQVLTRDLDGRVEITLVTYWRSMEDVAAFAGADPSRARLWPEDEAYGIESDLDVRHDVVLSSTLPFSR
ncbi:antibiotic biosynthesis monooxygenase family protein [Fundidesulfovibrio soli]|uniref:antibiotic biosynthesis monooxygenase family protein n=1 Tax=Fundidesulfovibrio soli TaxID=2922716 RepID=UPI001FAF4C07|nr:DUF4188 domain-containing protein [Fundidesulfovibrio soli]